MAKMTDVEIADLKSSLAVAVVELCQAETHLERAARERAKAIANIEALHRKAIDGLKGDE